jgi:hypothetical protein
MAPLGAGTPAEHEIVAFATVHPGELGESEICTVLPLIVIRSALVKVEKYVRCTLATCVEYGSDIVKLADPGADGGVDDVELPPPPHADMSTLEIALVHTHASRLKHMLRT